MPPHHLRRRRDLDDSDDFVRRRSSTGLDTKEHRYHESHPSPRGAEHASLRHHAAQDRARQGNCPGDRQRHGDANQSFERKHHHRSRGDRYARQRQPHRLARRTVDTVVVDVRADVADRERDSKEQADRIATAQVDRDDDRDHRDREGCRHAEHGALHALLSGDESRRGGCASRIMSRRRQAQQQHEQEVHTWQEEEQRDPRTGACIDGPSHRHAHADPQERQCDDHHERQQPRWRAAQQRLPRGE